MGGASLESSSSGTSRKSNGRIPRAAIDAVAGAIAGGISRMVVSPLDVIKIRFQVQLEPIVARPQGQSQASFVRRVAPAAKSKYTGLMQAAREIVREEGILGLWRGTVPGLLLVMPYTAIQFVVVHKFKTLLAGSSKEEDFKKLRPELSFLTGSVAGVAATIGSYPFDLLRTVLASQGEPQVYPNMTAAFLGITKTKGLRGLYSGLAPTLVEIIPYAGMQFGFYDLFKRWTLGVNTAVAKYKQRGTWNSQDSFDVEASTLDPVQKFCCGLAAGIVAKVACHPLDVVKKRFQVEGLARHPRYGAYIELKAYKGMFDALQVIVRTEGWHGLYKGTLPSILKAAPAAAITFFAYEMISKALENLS